MTTAMKFNLESFAGIVEELAQKPSPKDFAPVVELFREMAVLMKEWQETKPMTEDAQKLIQKIQACDTELVKAFEQFCRAQGIDVEEMKHYFANPRNFQQKQWEELQATRQRIKEKVSQPSLTA